MSGGVDTSVRQGDVYACPDEAVSKSMRPCDLLFSLRFLAVSSSSDRSSAHA